MFHSSQPEGTVEARPHFTRCTRSLLANASCDSRLTVVCATRDAIDTRQKKRPSPNACAESRRDQEEGGELDIQEEAKPRRDQEQGGGAGLERELDFFCFSCFPTAELRTLSL